MIDTIRNGYSLPKTIKTMKEFAMEYSREREVDRISAEASDRLVGRLLLILLLGSLTACGLFIWLLIGVFG